jgi:hypothetical protein
MRLIALLVLLVACGPSSTQIKEAKGARYRGLAPYVFEELLQAAKAEYGVIGTDDDALVFVTTPRWHRYGGQADKPTSSGVYKDSLLVGYRVQLDEIPDAGEMFRLTVEPAVADVHGQVYPPGDGRIPSWVNENADALWVSLHARLAKYEIR